MDEGTQEQAQHTKLKHNSESEHKAKLNEATAESTRTDQVTNKQPLHSSHSFTAQQGISNASLKTQVEGGKACAQAFLESLISLQDDQLLIYALNDRSDYIFSQLPIKYRHFTQILQQQIGALTKLPTYRTIQGRLFSPYEATLLDLCEYFTLSFYHNKFGLPNSRIQTRIRTLLLDQPPNNYYQDEFQNLSVADLVEHPLPSSADVSAEDYPMEKVYELEADKELDRSDEFGWLDGLSEANNLYETPEGDLKEITIELTPGASRLSPDSFMQRLSAGEMKASNGASTTNKSRLSKIKFKSLAFALLLLSLFALLLSSGTTAL